ncbi:hypothetical protein BJ170DRAFT_736588 [Xylariales sp. AK1849]|nr:hypothetical protein BJ170DRAFT_736588 [Xylariales sp. AK1849]
MDFTALDLTRASNTLPTMAGLTNAISDPRGVMRTPWPVCGGVPSSEAECACNEPSSDRLLHMEYGFVEIFGYLLSATWPTGFGLRIDGVPRVEHYWTEPAKRFGFEGKIREGDNLFPLPLVASENSQDYEVDIQCLTLKRYPDLTSRHIYRRVGIIEASLLHLRQYQYILESRDYLAAALREHIAMEEAMVDHGFSYKRDSELCKLPIWAKEGDDERHQQHENAASFLHLCKYGDIHGETTFDEFYGTLHLDMLMNELREEEARVGQWRRRNTDGELL